LKVRIKIDGTRTLNGALTDRGSGYVVFQPEGAAAVQLPDTRINSITFSMAGLDGISKAFANGSYSETADLCARTLVPALPYINLPSDLSAGFSAWMISSYWIGDYNRAVTLADSLQQTGDTAARNQAAFFYRLARMEQGKYDEMAGFLKTPAAENLYPENSAARLYIEARLLQHQGRPLEAIRTAGRLVSQCDNDPDWMAQADLLCEELYFSVNMPESAQAVLADINQFYSDKGIQTRAAAIAEKQK
jgi:hypothetical protein